MQPVPEAAACHDRCHPHLKRAFSYLASQRGACAGRYMAARQFLGGISIDRRELTLDLHVSTNMADAQRPDWQKSVILVGTCGIESNKTHGRVQVSA